MSSAMTFNSDGMRAGLAQLWRDGHMCDCVVVTEDGSQLPAHRICLAAASGYFRACFIGAGANMHGGRTSSTGAPAGTTLDQQGDCSQHVVLVPEAEMEDVRQVIACMYDAVIQIHPGNLERLLRLASFLEVPPLLDACSEYMRQVLQPSSAVPLLTLASRYGCLAVRSELVSYICGKFSSLCVQQPPPPSPEAATPSLPARRSMHVGSANSQVSPPPSLGRTVAGSWPYNSVGGGGTATLDRISEGLRSVRAVHMATDPGRVQGSGGTTVVAGGYAAAHTAGHPATAAARQAGAGDSVGDGMQCDALGIQGGSGPASQAGDMCSEQGEAETEHGGGEGTCPLCALPKDLLLEVLHSDELTVDCEMDVLQLVVDWVAADVATRLPDLGELLLAVRTEQIPASLPGTLSTAGAQHGQVVAAAQELLGRQRATMGGDTGSGGRGTPGLGNGPAATRQGPRGSLPMSPVSHTPLAGGSMEAYTAAQEVTQPVTQAAGGPGAGVGGALGPGTGVLGLGVSAAGSQSPAQRRMTVAFGRPRRPQPTTLVAAGGHDASWRSLKLVEVYDPTSNCWSPGPAMLHSVSFAAGAIVDRELHVVGGTPLWSCVSRLLGGGTHWAACPNLPSPRAHAGVVSAARSLFVMGGRSQVQTTQQVLPAMEILSAGHWDPGPPMTTPRSALAAVTLRGGLYAIGGQTAKLSLKTVERFDLGSETWTCLSAGLMHERKYASAAVLGGRIYLVGGLDEARTRLSLVEALDPREGRWTQTAPLSMARSSAGLAALQIGAHGRLYAVGGSAPGDHVHDSMEAFVPEMGRWISLAPLGCARSGLALCPL